MKIYIVTIQAGTNGRIIHSIWASEKRAGETMEGIKVEMQRTGKYVSQSAGWWVWYSEAEILDAEIK